VTLAPPDAGRSFADDEKLLSDVLEQVIGAAEGSGALELHRRAVELGRRSRGGDPEAAAELAALVSTLDTSEIELLIRSLTRWFQLVNLAETTSACAGCTGASSSTLPRRDVARCATPSRVWPPTGRARPSCATLSRAPKCGS
jgi:phosphoenolpyruvate carboxylase